MAYTWTYPLVNGGMANVAAASPNGDFQVGGDLWGWYRSKDAARGWIGQMHGAGGIGSIYARGACFSRADPDACYIAIGVLKSGGGYFGVCKGIALTRRSGPQYGGNITSGSPAATMPRPVGSLIDVTQAGGVERIVTGAYNGIFSSTDKGASFHSLYQHNGNWKAIAAIDETTCIAALYQQTTGLTLVKGSTVSHPNSPGVLHDLRNIAGTVWAVGPGGYVGQWTGSAFAKHAAASAAVAGCNVVTIDGSTDGQTLLIGTATAGKAAVVSHDGGKTGQQGGTPAHAATTYFDGRPHWLASNHNGWGGTQFACSHAAVSKTDPNVLYMAGRQGGWCSHDGGQTWHPAAPAGNEVTALRGGPGADEFAGDDTDWVGWHTTDAFGHTTSKQAQSGLHAALAWTGGGHSYSFRGGDVYRDGQVISDDIVRGAAIDVKAGAVSPSGKVLLAQYGGTLILGTP